MLFNKHISFKKGNEVINIDDGWDNVMDQEYYRVCSQESFSSRTRIESNQNFLKIAIAKAVLEAMFIAVVIVVAVIYVVVAKLKTVVIVLVVSVVVVFEEVFGN